VVRPLKKKLFLCESSLSELKNYDSLDIDKISTALKVFIPTGMHSPRSHFSICHLNKVLSQTNLSFLTLFRSIKELVPISDMSNCRPISLVSSISKVLEKIIFKRVVFFLINSSFF
jgi:hypothetical protein